MSGLTHMPATPRLSDLARAANGRLHGADQDFADVGIDTRRLAEKDVFFALQGNHDGHEHVAQAAALGAAGAVVERLQNAPLAQIQVDNTEQALQQAGAAWRQTFAGPVIGVTGSNGKTTVRRMLAAILAQCRAPVLASSGNFNNHLGVPLTLLGLRAHHASAVIEMGANHAGEITALSHLVQAQVAVVTNAGDAHLEGFGSRAGVARAKGEIYAALAPGASAIINADDAYAEQWTATAAHCRRLYFSLDGGHADVAAEQVALTDNGSRFALRLPNQRVAIELALPGEHNVRNALAAAAAAHTVGAMAADIAAGLGAITAAAGRLAAMPGLHGARLIDDSYNANPASLQAALHWLAAQPGPRWLVLGDMGELGAATAQAHRDAGLQARAAGIEQLWATGPASEQAAASFGDGGQWFACQAQLGDALLAALAGAAERPTLLVKGSRSAHMDRIVALLAPAAAGGEPC